MANEIKEMINKIEQIVALEQQLEGLKNEVTPIIRERALDVLEWENANIGTEWDVRAKNVYYSYRVNYDSNGISIRAKISWSYGGYDTESYYIPYEHLFSDDWKEEAIKKYQLGKEAEEKKRQEEKEAKDRALYEKLKAQFENKE